MGFDFNPMFWYICQGCRQAFPNTDELKRHKLENHLGDCLRIKCVVFEETLLDYEWIPANLSYIGQSPVLKAIQRVGVGNQLVPVQVERFQNPFIPLKRLSCQELDSDSGVQNNKFHNSKFGTKRRVDRSSIDPTNLQPTKKCKQIENDVGSFSNRDALPHLLLIPKEEIEEEGTEFVENLVETAVVLQDGAMITASISTLSDGTGQVCFESVPFESALAFPCANPEFETETQNEGRSSKSEIVQDFDNDHDYVPSDDEDTHSESSPLTPKLSEPESESDFDEVPLIRRLQKKLSIKTRFKTRSTNKLVKTKSKNHTTNKSTTDEVVDLNLDLPLCQWLKQQKNSNPTNIILLDPDPTTIADFQTVSTENSVKCKLCTVSFTSEETLRNHVSNCWLLNKSKHRYCQICDKSFNHVSSWKNHNIYFHQSTLALGTTLKCKFCSKQLFTKVGLRLHIKWRHPDSDPEKSFNSYVCPTCNTCLRSELLFLRHLKFHSAKNQFKCTLCPATFQNNKRLQDHTLLHENSTAPRCKFCSQPCLNQKLLSQHEISHTFSNRPFKCDVENCTWASTTKNYLLVHKHIKHWKELGFQELSCPVSGCEEKFGYKNRLKFHVGMYHPDYQQSKPDPLNFDEASSKHRLLKKRSNSTRVTNRAIKTKPKIQTSDAPEVQFKCTLCHLTFKQNKRLQKHLLLHKSDSAPLCEVCSAPFLNKAALIKHEATHHLSNRPFTCDIGNCTWASEKDILLRHKRSKHWKELGLQELSCPVPDCEKKFGHESTLKIHVQKCHPDHEAPEPESKKRTRTRVLYKCPEPTCTKTFGCKIHLKHHINKEHPDSSKILTPFVCEYCGSSFVAKFFLTRHIQQSHADKSWKCPECPAAFRTKQRLARHSLLHGAETKHKCRFCGRSFQYKKQLSSHERTHTGERPYICTVQNCNCSFLSKHALATHEKRKHSKELGLPEFLCANCGKTFGFQSHLDAHIRVQHAGEKQFKCSYEGCSHEFHRKGNLNIHVRMKHTGERPYQCDQCGKGYAKRAAFKRHQQTHEGTVPFVSCQLCERKFQGGWPLKKHMEDHQKGNEFPCQFCKLVFTTKMYLKKHEKSHERVEDEEESM